MIYAGQIIELGERSKSMIDKVAPQEQAKPAESASTATATAQTAQKQTTYAANAAVTSAQSTNGGIVLSNGNTAGEQGSYAAARMAEMTGVPASTWEANHCRESNGQVNAAKCFWCQWFVPNNVRGWVQLQQLMIKSRRIQCI